VGASVRYRFGEFVLDVAERSLVRCDAPSIANGGPALTSGHMVQVPLQPKTFDLLVHLVGHPGTLQTKQALLDAIWSGVIVTESSLTRSIHQLRTALDDVANEPRFVETVPRVGYRFIAPVTSEVPEVQSSAAARPPVAVSTRRPIALALLAVVALATLAYVVWRDRIDASTPTAIAVLPFTNMSSDPENELFSDGISEEILNLLSRHRELRIIARTSSFAFKNSNYDAKRLAAVLDVNYMLQGSVRRDGKALRISTQLIDATGRQVWSEIYDREAGAIFAIQRELADAVVANVAPHLSLPSVSEKPPDLEAYRSFLIGRELVQKRVDRYTERAPPYFERALSIDPGYAEARAELALVLAVEFQESGGATQKLDRAQREIAAALSRKPDLARAHAVQGLIYNNRAPPDLVRAEESLRRALSLDPNSVDAHNWLAVVLAQRQQYNETLRELEQAAALDPLAPSVNVNLALGYADSGNFEEAERRLLRGLEVPEPGGAVAPNLIQFYWTTGRLVEATTRAQDLVLESFVRLGFPARLDLLAVCYAQLGMWDDAHRAYERAERDWPEAERAALRRAPTFRREGRYDEMLDRVRQTLAIDGLPLEEQSTDNQLDYGLSLALTGHNEDAIPVLEHALRPGWLATDEYGINAEQMLAWSYQQVGSSDKAREMLDRIEALFGAQAAAGMLHVGSKQALFARNALLAGNTDEALDRLQRAFESGWRDYYLMLHDPRWDAVREKPRFQFLMARLKSDIELQRKELEQRDREGDFDARYEALSAAHAKDSSSG
jgi:TolB-like protein/DNA-binding winged helix-turn-helix (wHTH) protein/Tfp pilus assembly protein PilF